MSAHENHPFHIVTKDHGHSHFVFARMCFLGAHSKQGLLQPKTKTKKKN